MVKIFIVGLFLGIAGVAGALYALPLVDQHREVSIISVKPNGGNVERFHISVPADRIMATAPGAATSVPATLEWPDDALLDGINVELYKLRNERDAVVGVASRIAAESTDGLPVIEWVLHMPARGSLYVTMNPNADAGGARSGGLRHGTREFSSLTGSIAERWVPAEDLEGAGSAGRVELEASFVAMAAEGA